VFPAQVLRSVEHDACFGRIDVNWQSCQVLNECPDQLTGEALSLLAHQKRVEYFVTPKSRDGRPVAQRNPLGDLLGFLRLFIGKTPRQND
jgi:hypothetical protein